MLYSIPDICSNVSVQAIVTPNHSGRGEPRQRSLSLAEQLPLEEGRRREEDSCCTSITIPGCEKTGISLPLSKLLGLGHTQRDHVQSKKGAPIFLKNVEGSFDHHDIVITDK